jgi:flagellar biosynthesis chaperone FliJ
MAPRKAKKIAPEEVEIDLEMLREDLITVLQAINQLEEHRDILMNQEARDTLTGVLAREKENFSALLQLMQKLEERITRK